MTLKEKISIIDITKLPTTFKETFVRIKEIAKTNPTKAEEIIDALIKKAKQSDRDIFKRKKGALDNVYRKAGSILHKKVGDRWAYSEEKRKQAAKVLKRADKPKTRAINEEWREFRAEAKGYAGLGATSPKIGFKALAKKVADRYSGKAVPTKYQSEYGTRYSPAEAREVGNKVAAKVYRLQKGMKGVDETPYFS